jgi:hypothetical protein
MRVVRDAEHLATGTGFSSRAMKTAYAATVQVGNKLDDGTFVIRVRSLHIRPNLHRKQVVSHGWDTAITHHAEQFASKARKPRSAFEILASDETAVSIIKYTPWGVPAWIVEDGITGAELAAQPALQPEVKYFIAHVIVPILLQRYIADSKGPSTPQSEVEE